MKKEIYYPRKDQVAREAHVQKVYGISWRKYAALRKWHGPIGHHRSPFALYTYQRSAARRRVIGWEMPFSHWWDIWQSSKKWKQRGRLPNEFCMARLGDKGPYKLGNVKIITNQENIRERLKKSKLPVGVVAHRKQFHSEKSINGTRYYIGSFKTPQAAYAAWLDFSAPKT